MPPVAGAKDQPPRGRARSAAPLLAAFAAIAAGFIASTLYGELRASQIDSDAALIETNSLPSVEMIVAAESSLRHLEEGTEALARANDEERGRAASAVETARREMERELRAESLTGMYPGEAELTAAVTRALRDLDALLARLIALSPTDPAAAKALSEGDVREAIDATDAALDRLLSLNATEAHAEAQRIARIRAESVRLALGLGALCIVFSAAAAVVAVRALRKQEVAERAREELAEARADELEMFAMRVAHDLLSPLSALSFTLAAVKRNGERGLPIDEPLQRSLACLKRLQRLVDGVLDFARSAASPSPGERASVRDAIEGVLDEVRSDDGTDPGSVQLAVVAPDGDVIVRCAPGILVSVVSNLVRNAVKYMGDGDGAEKRVTIRILPSADDVRVEVADTGPGLSPELAEHVFEPYFRAPNNPKPGIGLGLATVRRFVEAHGGTLGVHPAPEHGSVFWFQLPRIPGSATNAAGAPDR